MGSNFSAQECVESVSSCTCISNDPNHAVGGRTVKKQDVSWKDMYHMGGNKLHAAAIRGDEYAAKQLVVQEGYEIDAKDRAGRTPFMLACRYGRVNTAKLLLRLGADFNAIDEDGLSALHGIQHAHTKAWLEKYHRTGRVSEVFEYHNVSKRETPQRTTGSRRGSAHSTVSAASSVVSAVRLPVGDPAPSARSVASSFKSDSRFGMSEKGSFKSVQSAASSRFRALTPKKPDCVGPAPKSATKLGMPPRAHATPTKAHTPQKQTNNTNARCTPNKENSNNGIRLAQSPGIKRMQHADVLSPVSPNTAMKREMTKSMSTSNSMRHVNVQGGASPDVRRLMTNKSRVRRGSARSVGSGK